MKTTFIEKANQKHKNKYFYDKTIYTRHNNRVIITCPFHGDFEQTPTKHLLGRGCQECGGSKKLTLEKFINKANQIHKNFYSYDKVIYKNWKTKIIIICPVHGHFKQTPNKHLCGDGCPGCGGSKVLTTDIFIQRAKKIHGAKYSYEKVEYVNNHTKIKIFCHKHGYFYQEPNNHLHGQGCNRCRESRGEKCVRTNLELLNSTFIYQYKISECKNILPLPFDFAIIDRENKLLGLIEYHGEQHYQEKFFGGEKSAFNAIKNRDTIKQNFCQNKKIPLLIIPYWEYKDIKSILLKFLKEINAQYYIDNQ